MDHYLSRKRGRYLGNASKPNREEEVSTLLKEEGFEQREIFLIKALFLETHPYLENGTNDLQKDRSVRRDAYFLNYFGRDRLPDIETLYGNALLRRAANNTNDPIGHVYQMAYTNWKSDERQDIRSIIIESLVELIKELDQIQSYNCLIALGRLAKEMSNDLILRQKRFSVSTVSNFLLYKTSGGMEAKDFILSVLREDVSHAMYTHLIFFLFVDEENRRLKIKGIEPYFDEIKSYFDTRCKQIFYGLHGGVKDLLDVSVTDEPMEMMFRWAQVQSDRSHSKYLLSFLQRFPRHASEFIRIVRKGSHEQESVEILMPKDYWKIFFDDPKIKATLEMDDIDFIERVLAGEYSDGLLSE